MLKKILFFTVVSAFLTASSLVQAEGEKMPRSGYDCYYDDFLCPPMFFAQVDIEDTPMNMPGKVKAFGRAKGEYMEAMEQQRKHLEQFRLLKMLELLDLDEEHEVAFLTSFRSMRKDISNIWDERKGLVEKLVESIHKGDVSGDQVDKIVSELLRLDNEKNVIMKNFFNNVKTLLTPEQMAKFIVFQEKFEFELLDQMRDFKSRGRGERP